MCGTSYLKIASNSSRHLGVWNKGSPISISANIQPADHKSIEAEY